MTSPESREQIIRYLLDEMSAEESFDLEERLEHEPSFFQAIAAVEDDLILRYVRGDLERGLVPRFTEVYLESPVRRARVEAARALRQAAHDLVPLRKTGRWFFLQLRPLMLTAAAVIVCVVLLWMVLKRFPEPAPRQDQFASVTFSLQAGAGRSPGGVQIAIPSGTQLVRFELTLVKPIEKANYRAVLGTAERTALWSGPASPISTGFVAAIPATILAAGDYDLELQVNHGSSWEEVEAYSFRVEQR